MSAQLPSPPAERPKSASHHKLVPKRLGYTPKMYAARPPTNRSPERPEPKVVTFSPRLVDNAPAENPSGIITAAPTPKEEAKPAPVVVQEPEMTPLKKRLHQLKEEEARYNVWNTSY